ncbi:MAG: methyltransferase domain-containing protein [Verrucomicrobiales bacterium]|nr:methyltransferase domain-containing protein [Verrucomicrobiales bacterium]
MLTTILFTLAGIFALMPILNFLSYRVMGGIIRNRREKWDLNICCGKTDGGGVNVDIVKHADVPNLIVVDSIYDLPFSTDQFDNLLCSHTIEHVEDPEAFFNELQRISKEVTLVIPPLWDLSAVLNIFEHRWIFLTFRKEHHKLPNYIKLPLAKAYQEKKGQKIRA